MDTSYLQFFPRGVPPRITIPALTLYDNLAISARRFPQRAALVFYNGVVDYQTTLAQVDAMAGYLQQHCGVVHGDRVLLMSQNCPQFVIAFYAIVRLGAVVVPVNVMSTQRELEHYMDDSGACVAFCAHELYPALRPGLDSGRLQRIIVHRYADYLQDADDEIVPGWVRQCPPFPDDPAVTSWDSALAAQAQALPQTVTPHDLCVLPYTSGTTGNPKGCMHEHYSMMASLQGSVIWRGLSAESVFLCVAPMFHMLGMQGAMNVPILLGATMVIMSRWDRDVAALLMEKWRVSTWGAPPAMVVDLFAHPRIGGIDLSSLSHLSGGGAAMPEAVSRRLSDDYGIVYNEAYGLTETAAFLHANPVTRGKRQCLGLPTYGVTSRVIDPDSGAELAVGEIGELIVHGEQVMRGYWNNDAANRDAFLQRDGLRFFRTGDLVYQDEEGYFFLVDRLKRMINVSGYKVWPAEVENFMYHHPAVHEACVIAMPDVKSGERVRAVVVLKDGQQGSVSEQQIVGWARDNMAVYKAPREVVFVSELAKSGSGKILWRRIQEEQRAASA